MLGFDHPDTSVVERLSCLLGHVMDSLYCKDHLQQPFHLRQIE